MSNSNKIQDLFGNWVDIEELGGSRRPGRNKDGSFRENPMVYACGPGPEGERCKSCVHFFRVRYSKTYFKCELRGDSRSTATDHRANWPACSKFEPRSE